MLLQEVVEIGRREIAHVSGSRLGGARRLRRRWLGPPARGTTGEYESENQRGDASARAKWHIHKALRLIQLGGNLAGRCGGSTGLRNSYAILDGKCPSVPGIPEIQA
jgi:hypothetical protein